MLIKITPILVDIIQDLGIEHMDNSLPAILEPIDGNFLKGTLIFLPIPARPVRPQVKPMTKPTLRPRRHSFSLARSNDNSNDDASSHRLE